MGSNEFQVEIIVLPKFYELLLSDPVCVIKLIRNGKLKGNLPERAKCSQLLEFVQMKWRTRRNLLLNCLNYFGLASFDEKSAILLWWKLIDFKWVWSFDWTLTICSDAIWFSFIGSHEIIRMNLGNLFIVILTLSNQCRLPIFWFLLHSSQLNKCKLRRPYNFSVYIFFSFLSFSMMLVIKDGARRKSKSRRKIWKRRRRRRKDGKNHIKENALERQIRKKVD